MDVTQILMLITILVYLAAMVGIGAVLAKQNQTTDDFYLGGRTLGPLVTAMSAEASDMSAWLLMELLALLTCPVRLMQRGLQSDWQSELM